MPGLKHSVGVMLASKSIRNERFLNHGYSLG